MSSEEGWWSLICLRCPKARRVEVLGELGPLGPGQYPAHGVAAVEPKIKLRE